MIPSTVGTLTQNFKIVKQPGLTYRMDMEGGSVRGHVDGLSLIHI